MLYNIDLIFVKKVLWEAINSKYKGYSKKG
jgi:hypothetical protein